MLRLTSATLAVVALSLPPYGSTRAAPRRSRPAKRAPRVLHIKTDVLKLDSVVGRGEQLPSFVRGTREVELDLRTQRAFRWKNDFQGSHTVAAVHNGELRTEEFQPGKPPKRGIIHRDDFDYFAHSRSKEDYIRGRIELFGRQLDVVKLPRNQFLGYWCVVTKRTVEYDGQRHEVYTWRPEDPDLAKSFVTLQSLTYRVTGDRDTPVRELVSGEVVLSVRVSRR